MTEIVIIVKNGRVESVYSTESATVCVIDHDCQTPEEEQLLKEQLEEYRERIAIGDEFYEVY